jgi:hypothetical protein
VPICIDFPGYLVCRYVRDVVSVAPFDTTASARFLLMECQGADLETPDPGVAKASEPEVAVRPSGDRERIVDSARGIREGGDRARWSDPPDPVVGSASEPEVAVRPGRDARWARDTARGIGEGGEGDCITGLVDDEAHALTLIAKRDAMIVGEVSPAALRAVALRGRSWLFLRPRGRIHQRDDSVDGHELAAPGRCARARPEHTRGIAFSEQLKRR